MNRVTKLRATVFGALRRVGSLCCGVMLLLSPAGGWAASTPTADDEAAEQRLAEVDRYLSSDELEGRGLGAPGLDLAADYVAKKFREVGLRTDLFAGTPFQKFRVTTEIAMGSDNRLALIGPADRPGEPPLRLTLALNRDFTPTVDSGPGNFDLPLVFVGYGITAKPERYDDYAGVKVAGKAVRAAPAQAAAGRPGKRLQRHRGLGLFLSAAEDFDGLRSRRGGGHRLQRPVRRSQPPARHQPVAALPAGADCHVPYDIPVLHVHRDGDGSRRPRRARGQPGPVRSADIDVGPTPTPHSGRTEGLAHRREDRHSPHRSTR